MSMTVDISPVGDGLKVNAAAVGFTVNAECQSARLEVRHKVDGTMAEPEPIPVVTYTVTTDLENVTSDAPATVEEGSPLVVTLSAESLYMFSTVVVTMGGVDITSSAYDSTTDTVTIASVTGNVVISATAEMRYIEDGLIFHLDGIKKGTTSGAWTDLIGNNVFENNGATSKDTGWQMSNGNCLKRSQISMSSRSDYTVEVCVTPAASGAHFVFILNSFSSNMSSNYPLFYIDANRNITFIQKKNTYTLSSYSANAHHCISLNLDRGCHNGNSLTKNSGTDYWSNDSTAYVGRRNATSGYFNGIIHCIRIYNRKLTLDEMKFNQQIDSARFNLGLSI